MVVASPAGVGNVCCIVPRELAPELHELLRTHWRRDPSIVVVVERRRTERRRTPEIGGRRSAQRRGAVAPVVAAPPDLPPAARAHADRLTFVAVQAPAGGGEGEDRDTNRLLVRIKHGDAAAFDQLYLRYFDRVYAYARVALRDSHEAEDVTQQVFGSVVEALPRFEVREETPFRAWLFRIARNAVLRTLARTGRLTPHEPAELDRRLESPAPQAPMGLEWLSDDDLAAQLERLPLTQRQVILLRYVFEFDTAQIADALDRTAVAVRMLEHRAIRALQARLAALRGGSGPPQRSPATRLAPVLPVLERRRLALHPAGGPPPFQAL